MATKYHNLSEYNKEEMPSKELYSGVRFAVVVADWNSDVTFALAQGAMDAFVENGVDAGSVDVFHVPGAFELTHACSELQARGDYGAIVAIGCVVQGDTPHFDYVCMGVTQGITTLNTRVGLCPVVFSVLTTSTMQQALDRAGGALGNKGVEGAVTALKIFAEIHR